MGFSVSWDTSILSYDSAVAGANIGSGSMMLNTNQAASGKLGVLLAVPAGQSFAAGTNEIVRVSLRVSTSVSSAVQTTVAFSDQPVSREITTANVDVLPSVFQSGTVSVMVGLEGDLSPHKR